MGKFQPTSKPTPKLPEVLPEGWEWLAPGVRIVWEPTSWETDGPEYGEITEITWYDYPNLQTRTVERRVNNVYIRHGAHTQAHPYTLANMRRYGARPVGE